MVQTEIADINFKKESCLIYIRIKDGKDVSAENMREVFKVMNEISGENHYRVIIDARDVSIGYVHREAFQLNSKNQETPRKIAEAYVVNSLAIKMLANFYLRFFRPHIPTKIFDEPDKAEVWLNDME